MHLKIYKDESIRVETPHSDTEIFVDVRQVGYQSLAVDFYGFQGYIEIRKKENHVRVFQFPKKSYKKECDFGWWEDAEVIFSYNENGKDS